MSRGPGQRVVAFTYYEPVPTPEEVAAAAAAAAAAGGGEAADAAAAAGAVNKAKSGREYIRVRIN